ncbi:cytochrome P450 [Nonomuraea monospora]|uniref:Cytochrome P450 n=1 Tax=Nonomuraea monospora TaxID=568818 RepID=A0ABP5PVX2_9ACTN
MTGTSEVPHASTLESLLFALLYSLPEYARGIVVRRPLMTRLIARVGAQAAAQRLCMRLRVRHGGRSIYVRGPRGKVLVLLAQGDVERVLGGSDSVFSLRTEEKWRGFSPLQPDSLLLSRGETRKDRRRFNSAVLGRASGELAPRIDQVMAEELDGVLGRGPGPVDWAGLRGGYDRAVLRLVLGDAARDDVRILAAVNALRREGNWLGLRLPRPGRTRRLRAVVTSGIERHLAAATAGGLAVLGRSPTSLSGSLANFAAEAPTTARTCPAGQVPHWLMALEGIGSTVLGPTLALIAGHPEHYERARSEARATSSDRRHLRACLNESLRLWPLVATLPRVVTEPTGWHDGTLPAGTDILIPVAVHSRNPQIGYADHFTPQAWLDGRAEADWSIVPFSAGPAHCPGSDLGITVAASALATLLRQYDFRPVGPRLGPGRLLPKALDPFTLRLSVEPTVL